MFGTTDAFLRQFGLHSIEELPEYGAFAIEAVGGRGKAFNNFYQSKQY